MKIAAAGGSRAQRVARARAALPGAQPVTAVIVPGIAPTPAHNLIYHGGKIIRELTYTNCYVGGHVSWSAADVRDIDTALHSAMTDRQLTNVMMQYFRNQPVLTTFRTSRVLRGSRPKVVSQGDIEALIKRMHKRSAFGGFPLATTVFNFLLPAGTVLTTNAGRTKSARLRFSPERADTSLHGLGGYHGSVHVSPTAVVYYAVCVYSERLPNGRTNGIVAFDAPWKNVVATLYHELNEARTDPDVDDAIRLGNDPAAIRLLGWVSREGEECGDFPMDEVGSHLELIMREVPLSDGIGTVPVQFMYSNAVRGPEGPIPVPHALPGT